MFLSDHRECIGLCVTEHWKTKDQLLNYNLMNFSLASSYCRRRENTHGGSAIFIKEGVSFKERREAEEMSIEGVMESCACEIEVGNTKIVVVSVYRPDTDLSLFLSTVERILQGFVAENKIVVVGGDFNVDLRKNSNDKFALCSLMSSLGLEYTVSDYTRITNSTRSCIDNFFVNVEESKATVLHSMISDHTAQKISLTVHDDRNRFIYKRIFSEQTIEDFCNTLTNTNWSKIYTLDKKEVNRQWDTFMEIFINIFHLHFPVKKK